MSEGVRLEALVGSAERAARAREALHPGRAFTDTHELGMLLHEYVLDLVASAGGSDLPARRSEALVRSATSARLLLEARGDAVVGAQASRLATETGAREFLAAALSELTQRYDVAMTYARELRRTWKVSPERAAVLAFRATGHATLGDPPLWEPAPADAAGWSLLLAQLAQTPHGRQMPALAAAQELHARPLSETLELLVSADTSAGGRRFPGADPSATALACDLAVAELVLRFPQMRSDLGLHPWRLPRGLGVPDVARALSARRNAFVSLDGPPARLPSPTAPLRGVAGRSSPAPRTVTAAAAAPAGRR